MMKTRLSDFISEGRSKPADQQRVHSLKVSRGYSDPKVFRGIGEYLYSKHPDYLYMRIDPASLKPRQSAHSRFNHYTLWIDNDKAWRSFPKRSRSMVCTTSRDKAENYGRVYAVWPEEEHTTFGVCPESDIWQSFHCSVHPEYTTRWRDGELFRTPREFAKLVEAMAPDYAARRNASWICAMLDEMGVSDSSYREMVSTAKAMHMLEWMSFVFDPVGFRTVKYEDIEPFGDAGSPSKVHADGTVESGLEVWTSWPCYLEANI